MPEKGSGFVGILVYMLEENPIWYSEKVRFRTRRNRSKEGRTASSVTKPTAPIFIILEHMYKVSVISEFQLTTRKNHRERVNNRNYPAGRK